MTRDSFVRLMDAIKRQTVRDTVTTDCLTEICDNELGSPAFTTPLVQQTLDILANELHDSEGIISYFVYEVEWGRWAAGHALARPDGSTYMLTDARAVYDWLAGELSIPNKEKQDEISK